ncbi:erythromycin esterase [Paraphysoderma sedebokerense]|nr:erythromycin esterase [Paraphysoderma sedebokerense]
MGQHSYKFRNALTKKLIEDKNFKMVALTADFPETYSVNRYIQGWDQNTGNAIDALSSFKRFPMWLWRNTEVYPFIEWLRTKNQDLTRNNQDAVRMYGLDLFSLNESAEIVISYLEKVDTQACQLAKQLYKKIEQFGKDTIRLSLETRSALERISKEDIDQVLQHLLHHRPKYVTKTNNGYHSRVEDQFVAEMNAKIVSSAIDYYIEMLDPVTIKSWNSRNRHMVKMLDNCRDHLLNVSMSPNEPIKTVVWTHNRLVGNSKAIEYENDFDYAKHKKEKSMGELIRENHADWDPYTVTLITNTGTVTSAENWDAKPQCVRLSDPDQGTYNHYFSELRCPRFYLPFHRILENSSRSAVDQDIWNFFVKIQEMHKKVRMVGSVYSPETGLGMMMQKVVLPNWTDTVVFLEQTDCVGALDDVAHDPDEPENVPNTFPEGM